MRQKIKVAAEEAAQEQAVLERKLEERKLARDMRLLDAKRPFRQSRPSAVAAGEGREHAQAGEAQAGRVHAPAGRQAAFAAVETKCRRLDCKA